MNLQPIFDRYSIPAADREALTRYFANPCGIPRGLRAYFLGNRQFVSDCMTAMTRDFLAKLPLTDVELIQARDIDTLRQRHGANALEYARALNRPGIVESVWERMKTEPFEGSETHNLYGGRAFKPWMYRLLNEAAVYC